MTEDEAFVAAIRAQPTDDTLRLVYADWLDERDDPRGAFVRLEYRLHGMHEADPDYRKLQQQLGALGGSLDVRWLVAVCRAHAEYGPPHQHANRCPLNVLGTFYTLGTCLACEAPEVEAPDMLAPLTGGNYTTYFVRQPETAEEVERACSAVRVCCVMDLRYGGTDPRIIERLGNDPLACDFVIRDGQLVLSERADSAPAAAPEQPAPRRPWWRIW